MISNPKSGDRFHVLVAAGMVTVILFPADLTATDGKSPDIELAPMIRKLLDDPATSETERRRLALFHGQWTEIDDPTPAEQARIAHDAFRLMDARLVESSGPTGWQASAALRRGDAHQAVELIKSDQTAQGALLRATALDMLGRRREATSVLIPWRHRLHEETIDDPAELTAATQAMVMLADFEGRPAQDYHFAMNLYAKAHDELDRLYWPAYLAEAELLIAKDNAAEAVKAALAALRLNPTCGPAWYLLGKISLDRFDFERAIACEKQLRRINRSHLLADMLESEMLLTQRDPQSALSVIRRAQETYPRHRRLVALQAAAQTLNYDEAGVAAALARAEELAPGHAGVYHVMGQFLSMGRQYLASERHLRVAIERDPNWAQPRIDLGLMLLQSGKEKAAGKELQLAVDLDPFHTRAVNSLKLVDHLLEYEQFETDHFIIKFREGIDRVLAQDIAGQIETIYDQVTQTYGHRPRRKTLIEIMPDDQWFGVRITGMPWIWTIGASTGDVIALTPPRHGKHQRGPFDWLDVIQHEFVHTVTLDQTDNRVPHWFTEACAVATQETRRDFEACQLLAAAMQSDALFDLDQINWGFIRPKSPAERPLAYAQADWMIEFITHRKGHRAVIEMLEVYREGGTDADALFQATGLSVELFMSQFKSWAREQILEWGLGAQPEDPRIEVALLEAETGNDQSLGTLIQEYPSHPKLLKAAATGAISSGDGDKARQAVLRYAVTCPVDPWSSKALTSLAISQGTTEAAIGPLQRLDRAELHMAQWAHQLAKLHRAAGRLEAAEGAVGRALRREPYSAELRELAATIQLQRRRPQSALYHLDALAILEPDRAHHWVRLAALHRKMKHHDKSVQAAERALLIDPNAPVEQFLEPTTTE